MSSHNCSGHFHPLCRLWFPPWRGCLAWIVDGFSQLLLSPHQACLNGRTSFFPHLGPAIPFGCSETELSGPLLQDPSIWRGLCFWKPPGPGRPPSQSHSSWHSLRHMRQAPLGDGCGSFCVMPCVLSFKGSRGLPSPSPWHQGGGWRAASWRMEHQWGRFASSSIS